MKKKIITAVGSDSIYEYLSQNGYEVLPDISYQDGVLGLIKKEFIDVLIVSSELSGEFDKYIFIEKIKQIASKIQLIVIVNEIDDNYKSFLYSKGVFDIFIDGKSSFEELVSAINNIDYNARQSDLKAEKILNVISANKKEKKPLTANLTVKFQKQEVIVFSGVGSCGKTTISSQVAKILSKQTKGKVLLVDFDTANAGVHQLLGVKRGPESPGYILPKDKNSSLNYMIDAIDKKSFNANIFEKYIMKSKLFPNLDILTGNKSLYICKNILNFEYYMRILEIAKGIYDYIIIDTSGNIFLDSMQFSVMNATKVFVVTEGNYISMERTYRLVSELFDAWGVHNKKVKILVNKYTKKSVDKNILEEFFKEFQIAGYISFSGKYEEAINNMNAKIIQENIIEYISILEKLNLITNHEYQKESEGIKQRVSRLKSNKINAFSLKSI